jgi:hypothetical protein
VLTQCADDNQWFLAGRVFVVILLGLPRLSRWCVPIWLTAVDDE